LLDLKFEGTEVNNKQHQIQLEGKDHLRGRVDGRRTKFYFGFQGCVSIVMLTFIIHAISALRATANH